MKTNSILAGFVCIFSITALQCAAGTSDKEADLRRTRLITLMPVIKSLPTALGTLSIRGSLTTEEYGAAIQSWSCEPYSGVLGVLAKGGIAQIAAKDLAMQFPGALADLQVELNIIRGECFYLEPKIAKCLLNKIIGQMNKTYTTPAYNTGVSDPNQSDVERLAVLWVPTTYSANVMIGSGYNKFGEANVVPWPIWHEGSPSAAQDVYVGLEEGSETAPVLCWEPKK